ncbi:MAG: response regulator transcription factor [Flavobacteriales bacterium]|nr:response regulator transcription factor [Flavobacteriales bacterium]MCB9363626.1 response regulator transcription factor [Flavobacteriales bacterium]
MINAVIIDDEEKGRKLLEILVSNYCSGVNIVGKANSVATGIPLIEETNPDLVFLDVEMTGGNGFDLLEKMAPINFSVIFTTAYDQYAIKAFKYSALDYLLKPIDEEELMAAVKKVKPNDGENHNKKINHLLEHFQKPKSINNRLALSTLNGLEFVEIDKIIRCEADSKYTFVYIKDGKRLHITKNLKEFEDMLTEHNFFRIHHSHLVNLSYVTKYHKGRGGYVELEDGTSIGVSQRKKEDFLSHLNMI